MHSDTDDSTCSGNYLDVITDFKTCIVAGRMKTEAFIEAMDSGELCIAGDELHLKMLELSERAMRITAEINTGYRTSEEIRRHMSELTGSEIDEGFRLFPPIYSNCGLNLHIGKNVFINTGCHFQDQGGIYIGDGCLIGQAVMFTTLNHSVDPEHRGDIVPKPVHIGRCVWIGSGAVILPGITIGDNSIIGAGSVVTKDVPPNSVAVGNPARVIKTIEQ